MTDVSITAANVLAGSGATKENGVAGATITAGQAVYRDAAGAYQLADNNGASELIRNPRGIALNGAAAGQPMQIARSGPITIGGTLAPGVAYYLSDTPGGICPVADVGNAEYAVLLGMATSASVLKLDIQYSGVALAT